MKRSAPAAARNREPIATVLAEELPDTGLILEVAAGTGEHAVHFARSFPALQWQPSDPDANALASIDAWRAESGLANLLPPVHLDASAPQWPISAADGIYCCNMIHISPIEASEGLIAGAARILSAKAPLVVYGPFFEDNRATARSNIDFDQSLRARDPQWGLRRRQIFDKIASDIGFALTRRAEMPANNLLLVYRRPS